MQIERIDRYVDFPERNPQRDQEHEQAEAKHPLSNCDLPNEQEQHAGNAQKEAHNAGGLHVPYEVHPFAEA